MQRDFSTIIEILETVAKNEPKATEFKTELFFEEKQAKLEQYIPLMASEGLLRKVEKIPDLDLLSFRITWKGYCFLELFKNYESIKSNGNSIETLIAYTALISFCGCQCKATSHPEP